MTKASEELSASTKRRNGTTTLSTSACVSIPNGPSARVEHTISGPFANRSGSSAASRPRVTSSLEFGLTTRMRGRDLPIARPAGGCDPDQDIRCSVILQARIVHTAPLGIRHGACPLLQGRKVDLTLAVRLPICRLPPRRIVVQAALAHVHAIDD